MGEARRRDDEDTGITLPSDEAARLESLLALIDDAGAAAFRQAEVNRHAAEEPDVQVARHRICPHARKATAEECVAAAPEADDWVDLTSQPEGAVPEPSPAPRRRQTAAGVCLRVTATFVAIVALGLATLFGLGLWWNSSGTSLSLAAFDGMIASSIEKKLGGAYQVEIGASRLERDAAGDKHLIVEGLLIRTRAGQVVARVPRALVAVDTANPFGGIRPRRIDLVGATATIHIRADGVITVDAASTEPAAPAAKEAAPQEPAPQDSAPKDPAKAPDAAPVAANMPRELTGTAVFLAALSAWLGQIEADAPGDDTLSSLRLVNSRLQIFDDRTDRRWVFEHIDAAATRPQEGGVAVNLSLDSGSGPWSLAVRASPKTAGLRRLDLIAANVPPADVMQVLTGERTGLALGMRVSATIAAEIGADGFPTLATAKVHAIPDPAMTTFKPTDQLAMDLAWSTGDWTLKVETFQTTIGALRVVARGALKRNDADARWALAIDSGTLALAGDTNAPMLVFEQIAAAGYVDPKQRRLVVESGQITGPSAKLDLTGVLAVAGETPRIAFNLKAADIPVSVVKRLWPTVVAPATRAWVVERITAGTIRRTNIVVDTGLPELTDPKVPMPANDALVEIEGHGVVLDVLSGLPPIRDAELKVRATGRTARVDLPKAAVVMPSGARLLLADGSLDVPDTLPAAPQGRIRLKIAGPADGAIELLQSERLKSFARIPFKPEQVKGQMTAELRLDLPLGAGTHAGDVDIGIDADLKGLSVANLYRDLALDAGQVKAAYTGGTLTLKGDARIAGLPASLMVRRPSDQAGELRLQMQLDDAARAKLGLDTAGRLVGTVPIRVIAPLDPKATQTNVEADLTGAKIDDLVPGWDKRAGDPAKATFRITERDDGVRVDDLVLEAGPANIRGTIDIDRKGAFRAANFPVFNLGNGDKVSVRVERQGDTLAKYTVRGETIDARPFLKYLFDGKTADPKGRKATRDFDLDAKIKLAAGNGGETMRNLDMKLVRRGGELKALSISGVIGNDGTAVVDYRPGRNGNVLGVTASDAGALLRLVNLYTKLNGGTLRLSMTPPSPNGDIRDAVMTITDFSVRNDSAFDKVFSEAPSGTQRPSGPDVAFSRLRAAFARQGGRLLLRESYVWGPSIGVVADGELDFSRDVIQMKGTFIPAYGANNLFARLPVIGPLLGGGQNEGLFGVTFQVRGKLSQPQMNVNPVSALAPGFLRKLFEFRSAQDPVRAVVPPRE